tara:strand:- start:1310 stop:2476 length:1167 start_codon:yes stop_codon:yes gene_type:complete
MLLNILQIYNVYSQIDTFGGQRDSNDCLIGAGYTWCESSQSCIRQWETPCTTNCDECLTRQNKGENIACLNVCNMVAIDPMPPVVPPPVPTPSAPTPYPIDQPVNVCPEVMCMMYCEFGNVIDDNGCQMCQCNEALPPPITNGDCILTQPSCEDYTYVCPKMTEITNCNMGGIDGYTTFRLSVIIKPNMNIKNIYAIYGDENNNMYLPPAYQSDTKINYNIGGALPLLITLDSNVKYDSWLTIGITGGDTDNKISTVGIDFNSWTDNYGLTIDNGAVFVMDPEIDIIEGNEYAIGQISVRTGAEFTAIVSVQGKTIDNSIDKSWSEQNIRFDLISPQNIIHHTIPNDCISWYDGCNTCMVNDGVLGSCTRMMCFREDTPRCIQYTSGH